MRKEKKKVIADYVLKNFEGRQISNYERALNLELSKLLKAIGFNLRCKYYHLDKDVPYLNRGLRETKEGEELNHNKYDSFIYSAPTKREIKNWIDTLK